ncbi:hypothetical protein ANCCAN_07724 [Ancylostoma caninum]|uniref:Tryptophan--tRNA ligase n=1 Tax=Ancylostoma caninum TaxID=29170 RepID=A0A368GPL2_ANCCA|nr:hypothetical protein ANCCAN_07724 [Ancylostoma caninum]
MFKATHVPVGADQAQHMNLLADLADHFNTHYRVAYFPRPQQINDSAEMIEEKCRKAVSDTESRLFYDPEKRPAISNLIDLYCAVSGSEIAQVENQGWDQLQLKRALSHAVIERFTPIREKFSNLEQGTEVDEVLLENGKTARLIAEQSMDEIQRIVGFT